MYLETDQHARQLAISLRDGEWRCFARRSIVSLTDSDVVDKLRVKNEGIIAVSLDKAKHLFLSTRGQFDVTAFAGTQSDVFLFEPSVTGSHTNGQFLNQPYFEGKRLLPDKSNVSGMSLPLTNSQAVERKIRQ